ncbi:MAG: helix-turn-helix transcriptional regulator [Verrucomicrobia bacterium]|nr:helix-turn-helix transcriptional regulator [Verrucomicrobiota bacterium]
MVAGSVNFIGGIERATRNPSLVSIVKLAKALDISLKDLVSDFE